MEVASTIRVRYGETDKMGVAYYASYYDWFEVGRTEFCRRIGIPYAEWEEQGIFMPAVESHCRYKNPAYYDDIIRIITRIKEISPHSIAFSYELRREQDGRLIARGYTKHAIVGKDGHLTVLPSEMEALLKKSL